MTADKLKDYVKKNNKIQIILKSLGCHGITEKSKDIRAGLPSHSNTTSISVKKDSLYVRVFHPEKKIQGGDIFTLVMELKGFNFYDSIVYLHNVLGLEFSSQANFKINKDKNKKKDMLEVFKKVKRRKFDVAEVQLFNEDILSSCSYIQYPHISWVREGIMPYTCEEFNIGYNIKRKRIVIPERYWSGSRNDYIGIMSRTVIKDYKILGIPKYIPLKPFPKSMNVYGLQENYKYIQESGYVVVFEGQKSVLKRHSLLDKTCVSIGSHDISDEQVKILISLNVEIIIAFDKGIKMEHILYTCKKFDKVRNVSYIYDKYDLLKDKDSPVDAGNKIYDYLLKYKIKYKNSK